MGIETILAVGFVTVYTGIIAYVWTSLFQKRKAEYRDAAKELGFRSEANFPKRSFSMEGRIAGILVQVADYKEGKRDGTRFRVDLPRVPVDLAFSLEVGGGWLGLVGRGPEDLLVGDPVFDEEILVEGRPRDVLARLDAPTRARLLEELRRKRTEIAKGELRRDLPDLLPAPTLVRDVRSLVELAKRLQLRGGVSENLARNAMGDPLPPVRLRNLEVAQSDFPGHGTTIAASRRALEDEDFAVRLQGARFLGEEGIPAVIAIATTEDPSEEARREAAQHGRHLAGVPAHVRVAALKHLVQQLDEERLEPVLRHYLEKGEGRARRLAVKTAGTRVSRSLLPELRRLVDDPDEETAVALADTFGRLADPTAETDLQALLRHDSEPVRRHAAMALAGCGTVASIPLLRASVRSSWTENRLARTVDRTVAAIQSRVQGAEAGQLSLAQIEADRGDLSLAGDGEGGELSIVPGERSPESA